MMVKRTFIQVAPSADRRDRWLIGWGGTIRWAWSMPKWLSPVSWLNRNDTAKRGGC
jgi:hypothetical protein